MSHVAGLGRVGAVGFWALIALAAWAAAPPPCGATGSVGVVAFAGDEGEAAGASLSQALSAGSLDRVVPPGEMGESADPEPEASQVRGWAEKAGVDHVVVGRGVKDQSGIRFDAELRSGHSGAAVGRYEAHAADASQVPEAAGVLASAMLRDLGAEAAPAPASDELPAVSAATAPAGSGGSASSEDGTLGLGFARKDAPIRITSDELEMVENDEGRKILFKDNVVVLQGDVRLETDSLEAYYPEGASQPERLVAEGRVRVSRGERKASCDHATYLRSDQTVVCVGRAELSERCDRVRGEQIQFNLETDRVRVLGGPSVVIHPEGSEPVEGCGTDPS